MCFPRFGTARKMTRAIQRVATPCLRQYGASGNLRWLAHGYRTFTTTSTTLNAEPVFAGLRIPLDQVPQTNPRSARPVDARKSQMIRSYTSLLRSTPLMLLFQHNNLTAVEWAAVRRELKKALEAVPASSTPLDSQAVDLATRIQVQVLRTNMFKVAFKITELYRPDEASGLPETPRSTHGPLVHDLSESAYDYLRKAEVPADSAYSQMEQLMVGPLAALTLPVLSTAHLAAALSVLSPIPGKFPAPTRRKNPGYYDPSCQDGLAKLLLVGGRVEGRIFDQAGVSWVGGIEGGLDGLRAQLVGVLQGAGLGITSALEGGSRSVWLALEGRKLQLEEEAKPQSEGSDQ